MAGRNPSTPKTPPKGRATSPRPRRARKAEQPPQIPPMITVIVAGRDEETGRLDLRVQLSGIDPVAAPMILRLGAKISEQRLLEQSAGG